MVRDGWQNKPGTGELKPKNDASWKEFWKRKTGGTWPGTCSRDGCPRPALDGARLHNVRYPEEGIIVAPLCEICSKEANVNIFALKTGVRVYPQIDA